MIILHMFFRFLLIENYIMLTCVFIIVKLFTRFLGDDALTKDDEEHTCDKFQLSKNDRKNAEWSFSCVFFFKKHHASAAVSLMLNYYF